MDTMISVVIPLYNGGDRILHALRELDAQTFEGGYEVLVVDDKSTDDSLETVRAGIETLAHPERFRVIASPENGRAGKARNTGVQEAGGEYILFLDQDDYPDREMLQALYDLTEDGKIDCAACDIMDRDGNAYHRAAAGRIPRMEDADRNRILGGGYGYVFAQLIRRKILLEKELFFPEKVMFEDVLYNYGIIGSIGSMNSTDRVLYYRDDDENSQTASFTVRKMQDRVKAAQWYYRKYSETAELQPCMGVIRREALYYIYLSCVSWAIHYRELYDPEFFRYCIEEGRKIPADWDAVMREEKRFSTGEKKMLKAIYDHPGTAKLFLACGHIGAKGRGAIKRVKRMVRK